MPENLIVIGSQIIGRGLSIEGLRVVLPPSTQHASHRFDASNSPLVWTVEGRQRPHLHPFVAELAERFAKIAMSDAQLRDEFRNITEQGLTVADAQIAHHPITSPRGNGATLRPCDALTIEFQSRPLGLALQETPPLPCMTALSNSSPYPDQICEAERTTRSKV